MSRSRVSFEISDADADLVSAIVDRVAAVFEEKCFPLDRLGLRMDLIAVHANGCPLDLRRLLDADDFNFFHDVNGIDCHINRRTGKLKNHFRPRSARPQLESAEALAGAGA